MSGSFCQLKSVSATIKISLFSHSAGIKLFSAKGKVILRLADRPEKRDDLMEWVLLSACLIVIRLPLAMAAGGAAAAGVGAIVGGIAGSDLVRHCVR